MDSPQGSRPAPGGGRPFFSLSSILAFFLVALVCMPISAALTHDQSSQGMLTALVYSVGFVAFLLAWAGGFPFAWRAHSVFWFLAVCLVPPLGSIACAYFVTAAARAGGERR